MGQPKYKECVLVVDDVVNTLDVIKRNLLSQRYRVFTASNVADAIKVLETTSVDLVITDIKIPKVSGHDLIRHVNDNFRDTEVVVITGYPSIEGAVKAVKIGAEAYLAKPFTDEELNSIVRKALDTLHMRRTVRSQLQKKTSAPYGLIGESESMKTVFKAMEKAASTSAIVLIKGESGTGKELVARGIHYCSARTSAPFVPVNCGGIPESLLESELFGYVKGSFTGAYESRAGFFQTADGGTIFLDEISETSPAMQVKLLRVLQDKEVCMVGSRRPQKVDIRIVAATNKDLLELIKKNGFREDLYYRLNVIFLEIPPLRERGNDILLMIQYFANKFAKELGKSALKFSDKALRELKNYSWPGNARELENTVHRLVIMSEHEYIDIPDLPSFLVV